MYQLLKILILPPASLIIAAVLGILFTRRRGDAGWWITLAAAILLYAFSTPLVADSLIRSLQTYPPLPYSALEEEPPAQAIVVLSAESARAPEYGGPSVGPLTLSRIRYAAYLSRRTNLPVLVSGGLSFVDRAILAVEMRKTLTTEFGIPNVWIEGSSQDTWENAVHSAAVLKARGVNRVYLVTTAWHMPRAANAFRRAGLDVIPAPTGFEGERTPAAEALIPNAKSLLRSFYAVHEMAGGWAYKWLRSTPSTTAPSSSSAAPSSAATRPRPTG